MYLPAPLCNMVYRGKSKAQKLFMCGAESSCTMPPLRVKRLCFSQAKTAFLMLPATTTTTQLVGRGSAKIVIPKIKQMTEREKNTKRRTCWRKNFFSRSHADKITSIQLVLRSSDKCDSLFIFINRDQPNYGCVILIISQTLSTFRIALKQMPS